MLARLLISKELPCLKTSDTGLRALEWMSEFKVSHLPIVNNTELLGVVSEEDIVDSGRVNDPIGDHKLSQKNACVFETQHIYDAIKLIVQLKLSVIPVVDKSRNYIGCITKSELVDHFSVISAIHEPGGILELTIPAKDYDLSQLVRIVETNDARVLSLYAKPDPDASRMEITVKTNAGDLTRLVSAFERFNYTVSASFFDHSDSDEIKERFDSFIRYLNT